LGQRGYEPNFDIDREYGERGEESLRALLGLAKTRIEVKRKRRIDDGFYVETHQKPRGQEEYKPSGINLPPTPESAPYWAFMVRDTGVVVLIPRTTLRAAAASGRKVEESDGDNPTKGRMVTFAGIMTAAEARAVAEAGPQGDALKPCEGCAKPWPAWMLYLGLCVDCEAA
jgi:hypothetical protein